MILQYTETENNECSDKTSSQHLPKYNFRVFNPFNATDFF